jgi:hypothetical protein
MRAFVGAPRIDCPLEMEIACCEQKRVFYWMIFLKVIMIPVYFLTG